MADAKGLLVDLTADVCAVGARATAARRAAAVHWGGELVRAHLELGPGSASATGRGSRRGRRRRRTPVARSKAAGALPWLLWRTTLRRWRRQYQGAVPPMRVGPPPWRPHACSSIGPRGRTRTRSAARTVGGPLGPRRAPGRGGLGLRSRRAAEGDREGRQERGDALERAHPAELPRRGQPLAQAPPGEEQVRHRGQHRRRRPAFGVCSAHSPREGASPGPKLRAEVLRFVLAGNRRGGKRFLGLPIWGLSRPARDTPNRLPRQRSSRECHHSSKREP